MVLEVPAVEFNIKFVSTINKQKKNTHKKTTQENALQQAEKIFYFENVRTLLSTFFKTIEL